MRDRSNSSICLSTSDILHHFLPYRLETVVEKNGFQYNADLPELIHQHLVIPSHPKEVHDSELADGMGTAVEISPNLQTTI